MSKIRDWKQQSLIIQVQEGESWSMKLGELVGTQSWKALNVKYIHQGSQLQAKESLFVYSFKQEGVYQKIIGQLLKFVGEPMNQGKVLLSEGQSSRRCTQLPHGTLVVKLLHKDYRRTGRFCHACPQIKSSSHSHYLTLLTSTPGLVWEHLLGRSQDCANLGCKGAVQGIQLLVSQPVS